MLRPKTVVTTLVANVRFSGVRRLGNILTRVSGLHCELEQTARRADQIVKLKKIS